ncbi:MAG TPA: F0F1 ATP synthase subunit B [Patescibacteria group bacterium]|nr:F0F1 ATP synthase subunit B [Patescibacteria group bacterium]
MELFKDFGFDPVFFTAQIINFLIIAFVFKKYLYKPVLKTLKERQKTIAQGLADAENAHKSLEEAESKKDEIIKKATVEAERIIEETKKSADDMRAELNTVAKREAERIIEEARLTAKEEREKGKKDAESMALDMSKTLLDRILDEMFTKQEKEKIIQRNISKLGKYD